MHLGRQQPYASNCSYETPIFNRIQLGFVTAGAEIAGTQEPDAGEGAVEFVYESLRDGGENDLKIETRGHMERNTLQNGACLF